MVPNWAQPNQPGIDDQMGGDRGWAGADDLIEQERNQAWAMGFGAASSLFSGF